MSSPNEPEKQEPESPRPESATTESHEAARPLTLAKVDALHTLVDEYRTRDEQSYRLQRRNLRLARITAFLLFFYTTVAALQWCETREAVTLARNNFIKDQRPYVWLAHIDNPVFEVGQRAYWNLYVGNYGKSPAIKYRQRSQVVFGKDRERRIDPHLFEQISPQEHRSTIIIPPGDTDHSWVTAWSREILTEDDIAYIVATDGGLKVLAYIEYTDTGGNLYASEICLYRLNNGSVQACEEHNEIR